MQNFLLISQSILAICFVLSVLFQEKGSATSLTFGGSDSGSTFYGSKQGIDKFLSLASYFFGVLFVGNALLYIILIK